MGDSAAQDENSSSRLHAALLEFFSAPGKYQLSLRQPPLLFSSVREVLQIAAGRGPGTGVADDAKEPLRQAATFFIRAALLYPGADHYAVLGLPPRDEPVELKERYRLLMRLIHPDFVRPGEAEWPPDAAVRVNRAYEVLSSPVLRRDYEQHLGALKAARPLRTPPADARCPAEPEWGRRQLSAPLRRTIWAAGLCGVLLAAGILVPRTEPVRLVQKSQLSLAQPQLQFPPETPASAPVTRRPAASADAPTVLPAPLPSGPPEAPAQEDRTPVGPAAPPLSIPAVPVAPMLPQPSVPPGAVSPPPFLATGREVPPASPDAPALPAARSAAPLRAPAEPPAAEPVLMAAPGPAPRPAPQPAPLPAAPVVAQDVALHEAATGRSVTPVAAANPPAAPSRTRIDAERSPAPSRELALASLAAEKPASTTLPPAGPTLVEAQPLLSQLLQMMESGSGDQLLQLLEPEARQAAAARALSVHYDQLVRGARPVRLAHVELQGESRPGLLLVTGRIRLHAGEPTIGSPGEKLLVRAEFAARGGKVYLKGLSGGAE